MSDIFLHHYDASPFSQKALRMLGIKGLAWKSVLMPMMPPKDELVALTGGYRGTPVLQIGADVYVDSQLIALELERRFPSPSLFPGDSRGCPLMLVKWSDAFFRTTLTLAVEQGARQWPAGFLADRRHLFHDFDWEGALRDSTQARTQFRAHAGLIECQLADGRAFLEGGSPGLVDVQAHVFMGVARGANADIAEELLRGFGHIPQWEARMAQVGQGQRSETNAQEAFAASRSAGPQAPRPVDAGDPLKLPAGTPVDISPDDTRRGASRGELVTLQWNEVAIRRRHEACGEVIVHFPRLGYRVERA